MNSKIYRDIDEEGDVLLILRDPNKPFAIWDIDQDQQPSGSCWPELDNLQGFVRRFRDVDPRRPDPPPWQWGLVSTLAQPEEEPVAVESETEAVEADSVEIRPDDSGHTAIKDIDPTAGEGCSIRFRLSSRHLILASSYFRTAFSGSWKESVRTSDSGYVVDASEWHEEALQILMDIIHCKSGQVPRRISLELLAQIAVVVDYYKCHDAVKFFSDTWIEEIGQRERLPQEYSRQLVLWLCIACVFDKPEICNTVKSVAVRAVRGPLRTLGLPFPNSLVDQIESKRVDVVGRIINSLYGLLQYLSVRDYCSPECSSILLGSLLRGLVAGGIWCPQPVPPFLGYSITESIQVARRFRPSSWCEAGPLRRSRSYNPPHSCSLDQFLESTIAQVEACIDDVLKLEDFL